MNQKTVIEQFEELCREQEEAYENHLTVYGRRLPSQEKTLAILRAAQRLLLPDIQEEAERLREMLSAAIAGQETLMRYIANKWIPVSERLPVREFEESDDADGVEVLVMIAGAKIPTVLYFDGEDFVDVHNATYTVTHWMPMPPPPEV